ILSQDQTLHKNKVSARNKAVKSPKPNQKQTNPHHKTHCNAGLANPQITASTSSHPTRENRNQSNKK
ncbi:hypothetical protein, partial [uncultured Corynebacterium sp.]|uniref:hypothetical protein n=1 Tax=uncultured Corynebacterium sp. TaxID=159447 RepID=UPI002611DF90